MPRTSTKATPLPELQEANNDAETIISFAGLYTVAVEIEGVSDLLFHRYLVDAVEAKSAAAKNSTAKKTDDIESYVYRLPNGNLALPGEYLRGAIIVAAKSRQDPRSPRKSAMDLFRAGVVSMTPLADLGIKSWEFVDRRRVVVQRNAVPRSRPGVRAGWRAEVELMVNTAEYITAALLREVIIDAGRLVGVGDFRPTFGRFSIKSFDVL